MNVLIGCPIFQRAWILPHWFKMIEQQDIGLETLGFAFVAVKNDHETLDALFSWQSTHPEIQYFDVQFDELNDHKAHPERGRMWSPARYHSMVSLRNQLLDMVNNYKPDRFFSLDSDILLEDPSTVSKLVKITEDVPVASPLMYMTPDSNLYPSIMSWVREPGGRAYRPEYPQGLVFEADIVMAAKMMAPVVYRNIRYEWHKQGEDLGWSAACARKGLRLYSASHIYCPHIMSRKMLEEYLVDGDTRINRT